MNPLNFPLTSLFSKSTLTSPLEKRRHRLMTRLYEVELRKFNPESEQFICIVTLMAMLYANAFPPSDMKQYERAVDAACEEDITFEVFQKIFDPKEFGETMKENKEIILRHYREEIAPTLMSERILKLPLEGMLKDEFRKLLPHLMHGSKENFSFTLAVIALLEQGKTFEACKKIPSFMREYNGEIWKIANSVPTHVETKPVPKIDPARKARMAAGGFYEHVFVEHAPTSTATWRND